MVNKPPRRGDFFFGNMEWVRVLGWLPKLKVLWAQHALLAHQYDLHHHHHHHRRHQQLLPNNSHQPELAWPMAACSPPSQASSGLSLSRACVNSPCRSLITIRKRTSYHLSFYLEAIVDALKALSAESRSDTGLLRSEVKL